MLRTKTCPTCGKRFSYEIGKGRDRKHCSKGCRVQHQLALRAERERTLPPCATLNCKGNATRRGHELCEACYCRLRRSGSTAKRQPRHRYKTGAGYVKLFAPTHSLADTHGYVFEHRKVLYDLIGPGHQPCHWCGTVVSWENVVVDHLNEGKADNQPNNLVISCNNCNRARGAMLPFIKGLRPEVVEEFIAVIHSYREHHNAKTAREDGAFGRRTGR